MKISNFEATKIAFYRIKNHLKNSRIKSIFSIYKILLSHKFLVRYRFIGLSNKEIFNKIYNEKYWGASEVDEQPYFSGGGSHNPILVNTYVGAVARFLRSFDGNPSVVDLGCGDFNVGSRVRVFCDKYIAVDIVESLIEHNKNAFSSLNVDFRTLDMTDALSIESLPKAQIVFIRQVFQHLSNDQIDSILRVCKSNFDYLVLTEELPNNENFNANLDIPTGYSTRLTINSGVCLTKPPFKLQPLSEQIICSVPVESSLFTTTVFRLN